MKQATAARPCKFRRRIEQCIALTDEGDDAAGARSGGTGFLLHAREARPLHGRIRTVDKQKLVSFMSIHMGLQRVLPSRREDLAPHGRLAPIVGALRWHSDRQDELPARIEGVEADEAS